MLEKGSHSNPTGNLLVYCRVIGENPFQSGCEFIASHIVVSFLKINDNFPVVTFPPVSYRTMEDLQNALHFNSDHCDIARLPDFIMPEDKEEANKYIQERMEQYNQFVVKYVELCKNKEKNQVEEPFKEGVSNYLSTLVEYSLQYQRSSGLSREIAKQRVDRIIEEISRKYPEFDIQNYKNALYRYSGNRGEELATLYMKKFQAIHVEDYEKASILKSKIMDLEANSI
jgi:uncharacterized protein YaaR (DUF327 family)